MEMIKKDRRHAQGLPIIEEGEQPGETPADLRKEIGIRGEYKMKDLVQRLEAEERAREREIVAKEEAVRAAEEARAALEMS